jgi:hypothetical protein
MRVLNITDHLPLVMSYGVSLRVPYMKSLRGSLRVVLSCIIVLLFFFFIHIPPLRDLLWGSPSGPTLG